LKLAMVALMVFTALGVGGCGKKARRLDPPDSNAPQYPRHYPPADSPGANL
jgi:hypothetical protein